jgi:hypothetical protein
MEAPLLLDQQAVDVLQLLQNDARNLTLLRLAQFPAATTSAPIFIHKMLVSACVTAGAQGKADWLVGISTDRHFVLLLETQGADAAVQLIGLLRDRVVFAYGSWLGSISKLDAEQPHSSLEVQPHLSAAITHLITGTT